MSLALPSPYPVSSLIVSFDWFPFLSPAPISTTFKIDGWSAAQKVKKSHPAAYELAVTANLREVKRRLCWNCKEECVCVCVLCVCRAGEYDQIWSRHPRLSQNVAYVCRQIVCGRVFRRRRSSECDLHFLILLCGKGGYTSTGVREVGTLVRVWPPHLATKITLVLTTLLTLTPFFANTTLQPPGCFQVLYTIKARTVVMVSSSRGAGLSASEAAAEDAASGGDGGIMSSAALERVVATATATYNEW